MYFQPKNGINKKPIDRAYEDYYEMKDSAFHIYPVEWVVRVFLGTYPKHKMDQSLCNGKKILDLGYGDGRNFPLLHNLGFDIYGIEISDSINEIAKMKFKNINIPLELRLGRNSCIPYSNEYFDFILACHAIYYVDHNETFSHNLIEAARLLKKGGYLIASLPKTTGTIMQNARHISDGHYEIANDHLGLRNGCIFRAFKTENEIQNEFSPYFNNIIIGSCEDEYFGIQQNVWTIICNRKQDD